MPLMKTLRYPFFFALIFSMQTVLSAQGRVFDWSRPSPSGQIMLGVASFGDGTFVLVGEQGDYLRTTDGGDSWHRYQTGLSRILRGVDAAGDVGQVSLQGSFKTDSGEILCQAALQGVGIVLLPVFYVAEHLENGRLLPVLPDCSTAPEREIYLVYPPNRFQSTRMRLFVDLLIAETKKLPWVR